MRAGFDFVIVGAGTAGCVLAARLSEDPSVQVCLIEAGGPANHPFVQIPALVGPAIMHRAFSWGLTTEPEPALDNRRIPLPRGKLIGGSGSINGMAYHRGHPRDYDHPVVAEAINNILKICKEHNVPCGHPHPDGKNIERLVKDGYRFLMPSSPRTFGVLDQGRKLTGRS